MKLFFFFENLLFGALKVKLLFASQWIKNLSALNNYGKIFVLDKYNVNEIFLTCFCIAI